MVPRIPRLDVDEEIDEAMVQLLDALKDVSLTSLDISSTGCGISTASKLAELVSGATKFGAAVYEVNVSMNDIGVDGAKALGDVISASSLKCLIIGPKGTRLPVNDEEVTELNFEGQEFSPVEVTLVAAATSTLAAVESIDLSGCGLTGATKDDFGDWQKIDSNMDGFIALCAVLGKVRTVRLADCGLGASSVAELSKIFSDATTAMTKVDIRHAAIDEEALDTLKGAVPEGCEVVWEPPDDDESDDY